MKIIFIGVGEACDPYQANTSLLVQYSNDEKRYILLDCGFTVPHHYFRYALGADELRGVWISHFHGDHYFGLPLLILKLSELGRKDPLVIIGPPGLGQQVEEILDLAYGSLKSGAGFAIDYVEVSPGVEYSLDDLSLKAAVSDHSRQALAVRIEQDDRALFYSGDGRPTAESMVLADSADLVVHEAYAVSEEIAGHGTVMGCVDLARRCRVANLALVHIVAAQRYDCEEHINKIIARTTDLNLFMPEAGDEFMI